MICECTGLWLCFPPMPWVSFWRSDTMSSRGGSLILQERWSDPLCCSPVVLFCRNPGICCLENVGQLLHVNGKKKEFAAGAEQTSLTGLGTRQADHRGTQSLRGLVKWRGRLKKWAVPVKCSGFADVFCFFFHTPLWFVKLLFFFCLPFKHFVWKHIAASLEKS